MSNDTTTIRPGFLVSLKASVKGGVSYETMDQGTKIEGKEETKAWQTIRHVSDVDEVKAATEICNKARNMIRGDCIATPFGLLCPKDNIEKLNEKIAEARVFTAKHNAKAKHTQVNVYVLMGEIASNDKEAARAILSDIQESVEQMKKSIQSADVEGIRKAAERARLLGKMLAPKQGEAVSGAVKAARSAATQIAKRVEKQGESAKKVIKELVLDPINRLRFAALDTEDIEASPSVSLAPVSKEKFAAVDVD